MFLRVLVNLASAMLKHPLTRLAIPMVDVLAKRDTWARNVIAIARLKEHNDACQIVLVFADKVGLVTNAKISLESNLVKTFVQYIDTFFEHMGSLGTYAQPFRYAFCKVPNSPKS